MQINDIVRQLFMQLFIKAFAGKQGTNYFYKNIKLV